MKTAFNFLNLILFACLIGLFSVAVKGGERPSRYQYEKDTSITSPFETSNNSSRYALTEAMVNRRSFFLTEEEAAFASPDLSKINDKFISIFTPGVSFLGVPFYYVGNRLGFPQIFSYLLSSVAALVNVYLIALILKERGVNWYAGLFSGLVFAFATNAFAYSNSFNQHHISTALVLVGLLISLKKLTVINNSIIGFAFGLGILVDVPNALLMLPILIWQLGKNIEISDIGTNYKVGLKLTSVFFLIGMLPFIMVLGWYNHSVTGNYFQFGQSTGRYIYSNDQIEDIVEIQQKGRDKSDFHQFYPRRILTGLNVLLLSKDRGLFTYSPILIFSLIGAIVLYGKKTNLTYFNVILSIVLINLVLYSLFNDPWGGWAFGSRYLIPGSAMLTLLVGHAIERFHKRLVFVLPMFVLLIASILINVLGAITTQLVPSSIQLPFLTGKASDNITYNINLLQENTSSSLLYNSVFKVQIGLDKFYFGVSAIILILFALIYILLVVSRSKDNYDQTR